MRRQVAVWGILNILILVSAVCSSAETVRSESKIDQVTVYPGSALVTRVSEIQLSEGEHSVIFGDIVPDFNENSLAVSGEGVAGVKLFGARMKKEYLTEAPDERVKELEKQIEDLGDQITYERDMIGVLQKEEEFLKSIKLFAGDQIPKDMVTQMPKIEDLNGIRGFLSTHFEEIEGSREQREIKIRSLTRQRDALQKELNQMRRSTNKVKKSIVVDLECVKAGKFALSVSYLVYGVNWRPVYDARVNFDKKNVELASYGFIKQTTGEDWEKVRLTLSTAKPSVGGKMPELQPWYLRPFQPVERARVPKAAVMRGTVQYMAADEIGSDQSGVGGAQLEEMAQAPAEVVYAQAETKGTALTYKIAKPVDIKADGEEYRVPISVLVLPAKLEYTATPKLSPFAYLMAKVSNDKDNQLLPGQVNIFLDKNYVGVSKIEKAIGSEEKFDLYLGIDEGVTVKRKLLEEKSDDTFLGNIPSPNKTISFKYKLIGENYKSYPIQLTIFDQIPVSQDDKIKIKNLQFDPKPTAMDYKDRKGVVLWTFELKPKDKKEVMFSYVIEHPRNLNVGGL